MTTKQVRVYSPGSIANLGPGFDVFGIAIGGLGDTVLIKEQKEPDIKIRIKGFGAKKIPKEPEKNSSGVETKLTGATNINDLLDVDIDTPVDDQFLKYNSTSSKWENGNTQGSVFGCSADRAYDNTFSSN